MIPIWFEIVRRPYGRFAWLLVRMRGGRRRVLARSERDYRSRRKVRDVIEALQDVIANVPIVDATRRFRLPDTSFSIVGDVQPLPVGGAPVTIGTVGRPVAARRRGGAPAGTAEAEAPPTAAEPGEAPPAAAEPGETPSAAAAQTETPPAEEPATQQPAKRAPRRRAAKNAASRPPRAGTGTSTGTRQRTGT